MIIVLVGEDAPDTTLAFERATRSVLGANSKVLVRHVETDPDDGDSAALAHDVDGIVEPRWSEDGAGARLHCYLSNERRCVDREINVGGVAVDAERELRERRRLLGFAAATAFSADNTPPGRSEERQDFMVGEVHGTASDRRRWRLAPYGSTPKILAFRPSDLPVKKSGALMGVTLSAATTVLAIW